MAQRLLDEENAAFWNTLCGWSMAREAGITGRREGDLRRFDEIYLDFYPYLDRYVPASLAGKRVLEVGLGYGTLGQLLVDRSAEYHGIDIAAEPVETMRRRLRWKGQPDARVLQASALDLPFDAATFDLVYSIGCLHHTGDVQRGVDELHRVLVAGGRAVVMLYNRHSFRRLMHELRGRMRWRREVLDEELRRRYDAHESGLPAPHTDFVSRAEARRLFSHFTTVRIDVQNFDQYSHFLRRKWLLGNVARVVGLDLYISADK